jgi:predicted PurR-regulated permease PerM
LAIAVFIGLLYFGKDVLMPLALAILLSFLLAPIITLLERWRFGRIPAVVAVVVLVFALSGVLGWEVAGQLFSLANRLPEYQQNLQAKIASVWKLSLPETLSSVRAKPLDWDRTVRRLESRSASDQAALVVFSPIAALAGSLKNWASERKDSD